MLKLKLVYVKMPAFSGYNTDFLAQRLSTLEPKCADAIKAVLADCDNAITFTDGYRSVLTQIDSIRAHLAAKDGKARLYAPPTKSGHQYGMSVDIAIDESLARLRKSTRPEVAAAGKDLSSLQAYLKPFGLSPIKSERWHFDFLDGHESVVQRIEAEYGKAFLLSDRDVQEHLNTFLKPAVPLVVDGVLGAKTSVLVKQFQERCNLEADGVPGAWTRRVLAMACAEVEVSK